MKLPDGITPYLAQVADDTLTTLVQLQDALAALQRTASVVSARIGMELSELDAAHHEIAERVIVGNHAVNAAPNEPTRLNLARELGDERRAENLIENCAQRSRFVQNKLQSIAQSVAELRRGVSELQNDQAALRAASLS